MLLANYGLFCSFLFLTLWKDTDAVINKNHEFTNPLENYNHHNHHHHHYHYGTPAHKVSLTQKGYIQFLRYFTFVPPLTDYTFCIWMKSSNLTHSHPLLSYSKNETERLIRVWVSPYGTDLNLEILQYHVFQIPVHFVEHRWYHICQSWSSHRSAWTLHLNGKLKSTGFEPRLRGVKIKGGGDMVVGQEYTDSDKGLDDGIEGDVFGFNFVLSSVPFNNYYNDHASKAFSRFHINTRSQHKFRASVKDIAAFPLKSSGVKLIELSFNCVLGKGAPLQGSEVLISWTRTPVRVFGGAIIKNTSPICASSSPNR